MKNQPLDLQNLQTNCTYSHESIITNPFPAYSTDLVSWRYFSSAFLRALRARTWRTASVWREAVAREGLLASKMSVVNLPWTYRLGMVCIHKNGDFGDSLVYSWVDHSIVNMFEVVQCCSQGMDPQRYFHPMTMQPRYGTIRRGCPVPSEYYSPCQAHCEGAPWNTKHKKKSDHFLDTQQFLKEEMDAAWFSWSKLIQTDLRSPWRKQTGFIDFVARDPDRLSFKIGISAQVAVKVAAEKDVRHWSHESIGSKSHDGDSNLIVIW